MTYEDDDLSLGFNFNDDGRPDADGNSVGEGGHEDDLADAESNADEDEDYDEQAYNPSKGSLERSVSLAASAEASDGAHNRTRANGQSFATQRPISADLDSTDELIVSLKEKGYSNDAVCAQLVREGRINYDKKTVGSRYLRLKNAILDREEERLDGELTDWHDGEDEALLKADQLAIAEIHDTVARTKARRWHLVAKNLQKILKKEAKYSPNACQKRFVAIQHGSATIPPELDDDPTRRFEEKAARVLAALHDQKLKDATEKQAKEAKRLASDNLKLQKALEKKERADKRAKDAEEKARVAIEQARKRAQNAKELEDARKTQADQIQALRQGKPAPKPLPKPVTRPAVVVTLDTSSDVVSPSSNGKSKAKEDPRFTRLTLKELKELCSQRGLTQTGTKHSLAERLTFDDSTISVSHLKSLLQKRSVSTEGTRAELQERLAQADANNSAWGQKFAGKAGKGGAASNSKRDASAEREARAPKRARPSEQFATSRSNSPFDVDYSGRRGKSLGVAPAANMHSDSPSLTSLAVTAMVMIADEVDGEENLANGNDKARSKSRTPNNPFDEDEFLNFSGAEDEGAGAGIGSDFEDEDMRI